MTNMLENVLEFLYTDQKEPKIPTHLINSLEECAFIHILLGNLRRDLEIIQKCDTMFRYLHGNPAFGRFIDQRETHEIFKAISKEVGYPVGRQGEFVFPIEWIFWNIIRGFWENGYDILEFLYITTEYSMKVLSRDHITRALEYSKPNYGTKLYDEWDFLVN